MVKKLITMISIVALIWRTNAMSLLTTAGVWGGWDGKLLNIQIYDMDSNSVTIQWNKVIWATSYCVILKPYFWVKSLKIKDCVNVWNGGTDPYVGKYTIVWKDNFYLKKVYVWVMKWNSVVYIEGLDKPLGSIKKVELWSPYRFLIIDSNGKYVYWEDFISKHKFAYLLADNIDYDWDGNAEWCYEDIWYDKTHCILYDYDDDLLISPPTDGNTDIALVHDNYDWNHPNNATDFCKSKDWFGMNWRLPSGSEFGKINYDKSKLLGLVSGWYWRAVGRKRTSEVQRNTSSCPSSPRVHYCTVHNGWNDRITYYVKAAYSSAGREFAGNVHYVRCLSK